METLRPFGVLHVYKSIKARSREVLEKLCRILKERRICARIMRGAVACHEGTQNTKKPGFCVLVRFAPCLTQLP
jgi:hypothetical protein